MRNELEKGLCLLYATLILGLGTYAAWSYHTFAKPWWALADLVSDACVIGWIWVVLNLDSTEEGLPDA